MSELTIISATGTALPATPFQGRHLINGQWCASHDGATFERASPAHGTCVSRSALGGATDTEAAIAAARQAFDSGTWSRLAGKARAAVLLKVATLIEANVRPENAEFERIRKTEGMKAALEWRDAKC